MSCKAGRNHTQFQEQSNPRLRVMLSKPDSGFLDREKNLKKKQKDFQPDVRRFLVRSRRIHMQKEDRFHADGGNLARRSETRSLIERGGFLKGEKVLSRSKKEENVMIMGDSYLSMAVSKVNTRRLMYIKSQAI